MCVLGLLPQGGNTTTQQHFARWHYGMGAQVDPCEKPETRGKHLSWASLEQCSGEKNMSTFLGW